MKTKLTHQVTLQRVRAIHAAHVAHDASLAPELSISGSAPERWDPLASTRTEVHALLQQQCPVPKCDDEDPEEAHLVQKRHGKMLWVETDRLVQAALGKENGR